MDRTDFLCLIVLLVVGVWLLVTLALWLAWRRAERDCRDHGDP